MRTEALCVVAPRIQPRQQKQVVYYTCTMTLPDQRKAYFSRYSLLDLRQRLPALRNAAVAAARSDDHTPEARLASLDMRVVEALINELEAEALELEFEGYRADSDPNATPDPDAVSEALKRELRQRQRFVLTVNVAANGSSGFYLTGPSTETADDYLGGDHDLGLDEALAAGAHLIRTFFAARREA